MSFDDYGPYRGDPRDPRTPDDVPDFDDLAPDEQREALNELPHDELLEQAVQLADDARLWHQQSVAADVRANAYARQLAERDRQLQDARQQIERARRELADEARKAMHYLTALGTAEARLREALEQRAACGRELDDLRERYAALDAYAFPNGCAA